MKFLVDENLPPKLASFLVNSGHDAVHVLDAGLGASADRSICEFAVAENRVIVSRDSDFVRFTETTPVRVVLVGIGNAPTNAVIAWFAERLDFCSAALGRGETCVKLD